MTHTVPTTPRKYALKLLPGSFWPNTNIHRTPVVKGTNVYSVAVFNEVVVLRDSKRQIKKIE